MRPVERDACPNDPNGQPRVFAQYGEAREDLLSRLGAYCSYCEMPIQNAPAVEHVQPKSQQSALKEVWDNFLLSCAYCNARKGKTNVVLDEYYWPDRDNTARAIAYPHEAAIEPAPALTPTEHARAQRTIELTGLDCLPGNPRRPPTAQDQRWLMRRSAWGMAQVTKSRLGRCNTPEMRAQIIATAVATGFFSVWMKVFENDPEMRCHLIEAFPGTSRSCFDAAGQPCPRPGGAL